MPCKEWRSELDIYLDGELESAKAADLMAHLRACPDCTAEILSKVQMKRSVQAAGKRYAPSAEFRSKILKSVQKQSAARQPRRWSLLLIPAFAIILAAFFVTSYVSRERTANGRLYSELADLHVATLASSAPVDVVSTDRHTVKPWFQGKIPFTFNLPELAGSQFSLLGGRVFYLEQTPGAHLIYQLRKHEISVFIVPEQGAEMSRFPFGTASAISFQTETWTQNGLRYFVLGDVNAEDIQALAKLLKDAK
jgi:anti-sigma factor RsiW